MYLARAAFDGGGRWAGGNLSNTCFRLICLSAATGLIVDILIDVF